MILMMISSATHQRNRRCHRVISQKEGQENTEQADGQRDAGSEKDARKQVVAQGVASQNEKRHKYVWFRAHPEKMDIAWENSPQLIFISSYKQTDWVALGCCILYVYGSQSYRIARPLKSINEWQMEFAICINHTDVTGANVL